MRGEDGREGVSKLVQGRRGAIPDFGLHRVEARANPVRVEVPASLADEDEARLAHVGTSSATGERGARGTRDAILARMRTLALLVAALVGLAVGVALVTTGDDGRSGAVATPRQGPAQSPSPPPERPLTDTLDADLAALAAIARRHGGNRAAGTPGGEASVAYVRDRLRALGFRVALQRVRFPFFEVRGRPRAAVLGRRRPALQPREDFRVLLYSGSARVTARVRPIEVTIGAGNDSGCRPGDFRTLRRGEIALVQRGVCPFRRKALLAQRAGAAAVLIANDGLPGRREPIDGSLGSPGVRIAALMLDAEVARALARREGVRVRLGVTTASERRVTHNVLAEHGDQGAERVVMAGGHIDSVPAGPGMNDNASGVVALLAAAEQLARVPAAERPRAVRLGFWGAEELGLLGSRRYVESLPRPKRRRLAAYLNLDMVASPNAVHELYGDDEVARVVREELRRQGVPAQDGDDLGGASDHVPFDRAGVPVAGLFTGASEPKSEREERRFGGRAGRPADPCYHRACDGLDNVDRTTLRRMTEVTVGALERLLRVGG